MGYVILVVFIGFIVWLLAQSALSGDGAGFLFGLCCIVTMISVLGGLAWMIAASQEHGESRIGGFGAMCFIGVLLGGGGAIALARKTK